MSKLVVNKIQKSGGSGISFPTDSLANNKVLVSSVSNPEQLTFSDYTQQIPSLNHYFETVWPMIFAVNVGYQSDTGGNYGWSSELGQWYSGNIANKVAIATGRHPWSNASGPNYAFYTKPPEIQYFQGSTGRFTYTEEQIVHADSGNRYSYPDKMVSLIFVKNTTGSSITSNFNFSGSAYWSSGYEGACISTLVPNATNTQISTNPSTITSISETDVWSSTSSTPNFSRTQSITIPADTTIGIFFYSSAHYYTSSSGYVFFMRHEIYNLASSLVSGLVIDIPRTIKCITNPNRLDYTTSTTSKTDIWK